MRVVRTTDESSSVRSFDLEAAEGGKLALPLPGQYVVLRLKPPPDGKPLFRSYSLSGPPSDTAYRISVKFEPHGVAGGYLSATIRPGDVFDVSQPRGAFTLQPGEDPAVLLSAGIGVTPVLAMLHDLANTGSQRQVWWLCAARDGTSHIFAPEVRQLLRNVAHARSRIWFSRPSGADRLGADFDAIGRPAVDTFSGLGVPVTPTSTSADHRPSSAT